MRRQTGDPAQSWSRLTLVGGALAALVGFLALIGWGVGSEALTSFAPGRVPMAPSTAVLFLLFGAIVAVDGWRERALDRSWALAVAGTGTFAALVLFLLSLAGVQTPAEHLWLDISGTVAGSPVGHMSPATAAAFMLAGASYLLLAASWGHNRVRGAFVLAALLELAAVVLVAGYLMSQPVLYGTAFIPPAPNTSVAFALLGAALLGTATRRIWGDRTADEPRPGSAFGLGAVVVVAVALVLTPAVLLFRHQQVDFEEEVHTQLLAIADLKASQIREWREERLRDAATLSNNPVFAELVEAALYRGDGGAADQVAGWLEPVRRAYSYARITLVDSTGATRVAVQDTGRFAAQLSDEPAIDLDSIRSGRVWVAGFHRHSPSGPAHFSLAAPILRGGTFLGAVELWVNPNAFLYPALLRWPVPSRTAETLLVRRDGDDVLFLNDLRFRDDAALRLRFPLSDTLLPAARAVRGEEGIVEGIDYRGQPVVAAIRSIPGTEWRLVARIDAAEVYGPIRDRLQWTLALIAGLLVGIVAFIGLLWQRQEKLHYRRQAQAEQRNTTLLQSIGDAVIATDIDGRVEVINSVAQDLTGWSSKEALGRPLEEVFRILNEDTREPVESPAAKVMREGAVVGLANSTVLIARDGTERPIADSGAPVFDEDGTMTGVILVFRDQTGVREQNRQLQQAVERSQLYLEVAGVMILVLDQDGTVRTVNTRGAEILGCAVDQVVGRNWFDHFLPDGERGPVREVFGRIMDGELDQVSTGENRILTADGEERIIEWRNDLIRNDTGQIIRTISSGQDVTEERRVQEALERNEARYRNLFNSIRDAILVADTDRNIIGCNPAFADLFGYAEEEVLGRDTSFIYESEEEFAEMGQQLRAHIGDPHFTLDIRYRKKSGEVFPGETSAFYLTDSEGETLGFIGLIRDLTERVETMRELQRSEVRYRDLFESAPVGIFHTRSDGDVLAVNRTMAEILGFDSSDELIGHYSDLGRQLYVDPDRRNQFLAALREHGWVENFEYRARRQDGKLLWVEMNARVAQDHDDGTFDIEGFVWDITERKRVEEHMEKERTLLERTERLASIGSWEMDVATGEILWSDELYRIFQWDPDEPPPLLTDHDALLPAEDADRLNRAVRESVETGEPYELEVRALRSDGEIRHCRTRGFPEHTPDGVTTLYGFVEDITAEKEQEQRQQELETQLAQAQKMEAVGRLAGGVAHDFNNMLSVILGHVELARDRLDPDHGIHGDLDQVKQAAESSANLTRQLLAFAREQVASPVHLDLNDTVDGMLKMLRRLIGENIELRWEPGHDLWAVKMDPVQVNQVLANLLVNSRDAIDGVGTVTIRTETLAVDASYAELHPDAEPGDHVVLSVADTGEGMEQGVIARVFDPFYTTKAVGEGTGLGLATVYGIVRQNGGFVTVYSEPGQGATFKVHLPRHHGKARPETPADEERPSIEGTETILVVEDQPAVLGLVEKILTQLGYTVLAADNPRDALELAGEHAGRIHLVITDVIMPEMNGRELADRLRAEQPDLEVLFMSGYAESVIAERGVLEEGVHFLEKPFTREALGLCVREALDGR